MSYPPPPMRIVTDPFDPYRRNWCVLAEWHGAIRTLFTGSLSAAIAYRKAHS